MHRYYWQNSISGCVRTGLNVDGFTTVAEKVRGRSLLSSRTLRISLIWGHRTGTQKLCAGYPMTRENVRQSQTGDIYLLAYFVKGHGSMLLLDSYSIFCGNTTGSFQGQNTSWGQIYPTASLVTPGPTAALGGRTHPLRLSFQVATALTHPNLERLLSFSLFTQVLFFELFSLCRKHTKKIK